MIDNTATIPWWAPSGERPSSAVRTADDGCPPQEQDDRIAFSALVAFTFILLLSPQNWFPFLKPLRIAFLAAGVGIGSVLWNCWQSRRSLGLTPEVLTCFALPAWAFLTLPLSYWPGGSAHTLTDLYIKAVIIFWLLPNAVSTKKSLLRLAAALMLCTIPLAGTGVKNFLTGKFIVEADVARIAGYEAGLSGNPNDLALMLNLLIPVGIALFAGATRMWVKGVWAAVIAINVVAVIVTFSRAGFIALAAIGILYFSRFIRRPGADRGWAMLMLAIAIASLPLLPSNYVDRVATVTSINSDTTGSSQIRWRDTVAAARYVSQHPIIGAGIGMDTLALNTVRGAQWKQVHNVYFEYAVDLGLPGIGLFLILFVAVLRAARAARKRVTDVAEHRDLFLLAEAFEVSLVVFALSGPFYPVAYNFYFYYMAGLALSIRSITDGIGTV